MAGSWFGNWEQVQAMLPVFNLGSLANITAGDIHQAIAGGLALGVLGSIDSLLTSVVADAITHERHDSRKAELVKLRYFAGLSVREAAQALGIALSTATADWAYAKGWLRVELSRAAGRETDV